MLVVNSAHLASLASRDSERWLPLFWALDNFKNAQEQNAKQGNWVMPPVEESKLPPAAQAKQRFVEAIVQKTIDSLQIEAYSRYASQTEFALRKTAP